MNKETEDWILLGLVLFSIYFSYYMFKTYFDTLLKTKTTPLILSQKKGYQERTLRTIITQALASTTTDEELYEILGLVLQENSSCWSSIQTVH